MGKDGTLQKHKKVVELKKYCDLKLNFYDRLTAAKEFPRLASKAILTLLPFSMTCLCELCFLGLTVLKTKSRQT